MINTNHNKHSMKNIFKFKIVLNYHCQLRDGETSVWEDNKGKKYFLNKGKLYKDSLLEKRAYNIMGRFEFDYSKMPADLRK